MPIGLPPDLVTTSLCSFSPALWHLPADTWAKIWQRATGNQIRVAVLDTGFAIHTILPPPVAQKSFVGQPVFDGHGHGTHCCGTSVGRNGYGVAPGAELLVGKVLSNGGSGSSEGIADGINWAIEHDADVISMSLGGGDSFEPTNTAITTAIDAGKLVVCAAGNSGFDGHSNSIGWPARFDDSLCVGATRQDGSIAGFSSGGRQMDLATPGKDIWSAAPSGGFTQMSGTSMACPYAAGLMALVVELMRKAGKPQWTAIEAWRAFLEQYCIDEGAPGHDDSFGYGVPMYTKIVRDLSEGGLRWL